MDAFQTLNRQASGMGGDCRRVNASSERRSEEAR
jgi:hypothetical protein